MTVTKNTIIAEILNNDPTQGCVPIFLIVSATILRSFFL